MPGSEDPAYTSNVGRTFRSGATDLPHEGSLTMMSVALTLAGASTGTSA